MTSPSAIVLLLGCPGVGKRTVGMALAEQLDGVLVDNQLINVPLLTLFKWDGKADILPPDIWDRVAPIRQAVLDAIDQVAPRETSYVFTTVLQADDPQSGDRYDELRQLAARRGAAFQAVQLVCDPSEHRHRIDTPDRRARLKGSDTAGYLWYAQHVAQFVPPDGEMLTLDTTDAAPHETAARIREHLGLADRRAE